MMRWVFCIVADGCWSDGEKVINLSKKILETETYEESLEYIISIIFYISNFFKKKITLQ